MPAKTKKQQRFMQAIAHNEDFAKKVGVPQSIGKEFSTMKKYQMGGMATPAPAGMATAPMGPAAMGRDPEEERRKRMAMAAMGGAGPAAGPAAGPGPRMKKGGKVKMMGGGMAKKYNKGGKVRGCGMAAGGKVRPCKMVRMAGA